jgi:cyclopropane-fatty-acyl-phospholipid synthase
MTYRILPHDARRVLETIFTHPPSYWHQHGVPITMSDVRFMRFLGDEMIPGADALRKRHRRILRRRGVFHGPAVSHERAFVRTLVAWAANLAARRDDAIAATSDEVYERYMRYLTGCADSFRRNITEVGQFTRARFCLERCGFQVTRSLRGPLARIHHRSRGGA